MARVLLFHYREAKRGKVMLNALKAAGHRVVDADPVYPGFRPSLELADPEAVVVDCTKNPAHGIESAAYVVDLKRYRARPVLVANLSKEQEAWARQKIANIRFIDDERAVEELAAALAARAA